MEILSWIVNHWVEISEAAGLLLAFATLITGLTPSPKDDAFVAKIRGYLSRWSVVTHKNAEGTFKLPGKK